MADGMVRGTRTTAAEDADFLRFFQVVQNAAAALGSVFFLWSPEGHDSRVGDLWCEDLSGWLLPDESADAFEQLWLDRSERLWSDELEDRQVFARWSRDVSGNILISFDFPLHADGAIEGGAA